MYSHEKPLKHKKTISINVLVRAKNREAKTMEEAQQDLRDANIEIRQKLEEMNDHYKYLTFSIEKGLFEKVDRRKKRR